MQRPPNGIILGKGGIRCQQEAREWKNGRLGQRKKTHAMDVTQIADFGDVKISGSAALLFPNLFSLGIGFHMSEQGPGLPAGGEIHDLVGL